VWLGFVVGHHALVWLGLGLVVSTCVCVCVCVCWDYSELVESLLDTMHRCGSDFTNTFRGLSRLQLSENMSESVAYVKQHLLKQCASLHELQTSYAPRMDPRWVVSFRP